MPFRCFSPLPSRGRDPRRRAGSFLRSFVGFSADHSGPIAHSGALSSHSGPIKLGASPSSASRGHSFNAFTILPPHLLDSRTPPRYELHEPTSPEVTCMGTVRRKKLGKAELKHGSNKKGTQEEFNWGEKRLDSPRKPKQSRWRKAWGRRETTEFDLHAETNAENSSDFSPASEILHFRVHFDDAVSSPTSKNLPRTLQDDNRESTADCPSQVPPPHSLLLIRNRSRNRELHNYDRDSEASDSPSTSSNTNSVASIWKRRGAPELSHLEITARGKLELRQPYTS